MSREASGWNASDYRANSSAQESWGMGIISRMPLAGDACVLDVGCGDGRLSRELARRVPKGRVVGIDSSPDMVTLARDSFPDADNLRFECMDARRIDLPEKFDVAFSNAVLHWFRDHDAFLSGLRRVMRNGASIHFSFGGKGNAGEVVTALFRTIAQDRWRGFFPGEAFRPENLPYAFFSPEEYRALLERNGFEPVSVDLVRREMRQAGPDALAGWIRTTWMPFTRQVPETERGEFIARIVDEFASDHPAGPDGALVVAMFALVVRAKAR